MQQLVRHMAPFHGREAALAVPALPLLIIAGDRLGSPSGGAVAAGAAFAVGFGAARELGGRRWTAMIGALVGMPIAALLGTLLGQENLIYLVLAGLAAAGCAAFALHDEDLWWVVLQVVIIFFVAGYFKGPAADAVWRSEAVLIGGIVQLAIVWILANIFPQAATPFLGQAKPSKPEPALLAAHMFRAALCVVGSLLLIRPLGLANGYWAPMTALIVLKPRLHETRSRGLARLGGTLGGCAAATLLALLAHETPLVLVLGLSLAAGAAYALQKAHYAALTASITATVVLLVSLGQTSPVANAEHRLIATAVGGFLALLVASVIPHALPRRRTVPDRVGG